MPALSRDLILQTALLVADRDGIDATSLRRVAGELDVHVTSLYHHVPTKEALLDGVVEELTASVSLPVGDVAWDAWVRGFVDEVGRMAELHPGAFPVLMRRPVQGPRAAATFETGLAAFQRAGFSTREAYEAVKTVALAVLGCCLERAVGVAGRDDLRTDVDSLSWTDFPMLHQVTEVVEDVDLVARLREVLVAGFAARTPT